VPKAGKYELMSDITNTGDEAGVALPQLYVHDPRPLTDVPVKELKRFDRLSLTPGQTKEVIFTVDKHTFAHYDLGEGKWVTQPGKYDVLIGSSSRNIRLRGVVTVKNSQD